MTKLRTLISNGFDVVELLRKLVEEIDAIKDEIAEIRQQVQERQVTTKPSKQPPPAQTQQ
jgi:hypothetical protein